MSDPSPLLEIRNLSRTIEPGNRILLDQPDLMIRGGDRIGLLGRSGSGKTTLLRSLALLDAATSVSVFFRGAPIASASVCQYRRQVVYLPQSAPVIPGTVEDNIRLSDRFTDDNVSLSAPLVLTLLSHFGRDHHFLKQAAGQLSGGEKQLVALVRALSMNPDVLLLDEPSSAMDPQTTTQAETAINVWASKDRGLIWISHDHQQLARVCNRRIELREGRLHDV